MAILTNPSAALLFLAAAAATVGETAAFRPSAFPNPRIVQQRSNLRAWDNPSAESAAEVNSSALKKSRQQPSSLFVDDYFNAAPSPFRGATDIDRENTPPNLRTVLSSLVELKSGSDLRGTFVPHQSSGQTIANLSHLLKSKKAQGGDGGGAALTPFASHCFGAAFASWLLSRVSSDGDGPLTICIGRDPRSHGERVADAFARGAEGVGRDTFDFEGGGGGGVRVAYTGVASTPSMFEFVRAGKCDAAIMGEILCSIAGIEERHKLCKM